MSLGHNRYSVFLFLFFKSLDLFMHSVTDNKSSTETLTVLSMKWTLFHEKLTFISLYKNLKLCSNDFF